MSRPLALPFTLGSCTLKNRIVFAPTSLGLKKEEAAQKLLSIAEGGTAMIILPDVPVLGRGALTQPDSYNEYQKLIQQLHALDCRVSLQLHMSDSDFKKLFRYVPALLFHRFDAAELRKKLNATVGDTVTGMSETRIQRILEGFGQSAMLAQQLGADMIQVHGDRLLGSFSSALYNHRQDAYGGEAVGRAQLAVQAVRQVRQHCTLPIDYKLAVRQEQPHYGNAGVIESELPVFVSLLEQAGADSFHVTLANHGELSDTIPPASHPYFKEEGCFLKFADEVRSLTPLPITGVGALRTPEFIDEVLDRGRIQLAAMSRQLIADPQWVRKVLHDEEDQLFRCTRCNQKCLGGMMNHQGVHCIWDEKRRK